MISILQEMQANEQKATMLQLVEKMKIKQKEIGRIIKNESVCLCIEKEGLNIFPK